MTATAREVVVRTIAPHYEEYAEGIADAVLAALWEHWASDEVIGRICGIAQFHCNDCYRAVIAALFEDNS